MIRIALHTGLRRALALVLGLTLLGGAAAGTTRWFLARRASETWERAALERAVRLEPDNAAYWHRLGQWEEFSLEEGDLERALACYRKATQLNPHESRYWLDLAFLLEALGQGPEAEAAVTRALQVDPRSGHTHWRAGNFWLRSSEPARAFPHLRLALEADPGLVEPLLQSTHRAVGEPRLVARQVLPPQATFFIAYLRQLVRDRHAEAANVVWEELAALGRPFQPQDVFFYLDYLVETGDSARAVQAWNHLHRAGLVAENNRPEGELLYNADLRQPILNGGFDWRAPANPQASVTLGPGRQPNGPPAVVVHFPGDVNSYFEHFFQFVPAAPNTRYRLQAWLSTEGITTESGPRLEVRDPYDPQWEPARSAGLVGTNDWQLVKAEFTTGPRTRLLRVGLTRLPSNRLNNQIRGTVRAAEFSLRPVGGS